jgi:hypothetical protein
MLGTSAGWIAALVLNRSLLEGETRVVNERGARGSRSRSREVPAAEQGAGITSEAEGNRQSSPRHG